MTADDKEPAYFGYYSQLQHQQNMLADSVRTSFYLEAVRRFSSSSFDGRVVMDIGAGSGILSFFSLRHGARRVLAVEASEMSRKLVAFVEESIRLNVNAFLHDRSRLTVFGSKLEDLVKEPSSVAPKSVDTIISEPIGVLLVHERMLESFVMAREHYLKEGGSIFPTTGTIHLTPVCDHTLWSETMGKARWWQNSDAYGVDFTPLFPKARQELFSMCVVGPFNANTVLSHVSCSHTFDFRTIQVADLHDILIPLNWISESTGIVHGLGGWFDCEFFAGLGDGDDALVLNTHPAQPVTHWQQIRFLLAEPLAVNSGDNIAGWFRMMVNKRRSYDIECEVWIEDNFVGRPHTKRTAKWALQDQTYYYPMVNSDPSTMAPPEAFGMYNQ